MLYAYQKEVTQSHLFFRQAERFKDDIFMRAKLKNGIPCDTWIDTTWKDAAEAVRCMGAGLITLGVMKNDCVALFSNNCPRWIISDQSIQGIGAIVVPIYPTSTDQQLIFILNDCKAKAIITGDRTLMQQVLRIKSEVPLLKLISCLAPTDNTKDEIVIDYEKLLKKGKNSPSAVRQFKLNRKSLLPTDCAATIYTSGTTGNPKGVVLSQSNFKSQTNILMSTPVMQKILEREVRLKSLCFLPLCHIMGRASDYHLHMAMGSTIHFAESIKKIQQNILEIRPQALFSIPRLYEKIYESVKLYSKKLTGHKKIIFDWALKIGDKASDFMISGKPIPSSLGIKFAISNILVYDKVRKVIGFDRLVVAGSGGGALSKEITKFFRSMNITITEGYGLTETTSAVASNAPIFVEPLPDKWIYKKAMDWLIDTVIISQGSGKSPYKSFKGIIKMGIVSKFILPKLIIKPGFVGRACKDTEIKIAEDGEVLVKGPQVFKQNNGYFNLNKKTKEVFTANGFFKTGDIGTIDEDGFLKITDRKKEILVTSGGKNVAPLPIEMLLTLDIYIDQACVIGDGKNFITALIVPHFDLLKKIAKEKNIRHNGDASLVEAPEIIQFFDKRLEKINQGLARYEQVKKYRLLASPFSETTGELTPTLKMKRRVIQKNYKEEIHSFYN